MEVLKDGRPVELGRPRQRAVLALLLLSANRVLSLDRMIELLWDGEPPAQATGALQAYISNLRRALEPERPPRSPSRILVTQAPGYALRIGSADLDAARFESLAARGHELIEAGRPEPARAALGEALSLWRGPALAEYAEERWARPEAARLESLRAVALEDRLQADLDLGAHARVVGDLESAVRDNPLRERPWGLLMLALYRSGRQAEALRAYALARRILAEELGVEPSPTLRALEADILAQSPALDWRRPPAIHTARGLRPPAPHGIVGRADQLEVLHAALADARAGHGGVVLVSGEAGIGKTRLAEELAAGAEAQGATVAWGRAYETEGAPPFWPWTQVIRTVMEGSWPAGTGGEELAPLMPDLSTPESPASRPGPAARFRLFEAVTRLLVVAPVRRPLVVVLDDLHWADSLSMHMLAHAAQRIDDVGVLVLAVYRHPDGPEAGVLGDVLGQLARVRTVRRLTVPGLTPDEVQRFMVQAAGFDPTPEQVAAVHARTEGNPFFVAELSRLLAAESETSVDAVPAGVRDVVRWRLARLPEPTRALLAVGAVAGRDFDLAVVAAAGRVQVDDAVALIDAAVGTGVVAEDATRPGHFRFSHALVRDTVYGGLSGLRRARLHARVGAAIEGLHDAGARTSELANHFFHAAAVEGPETGLEYGLLASEQALAGLAYEQAEEHLRRALELVSTMPPGPVRSRSELRVQNRLAVVLTVADGFTAPTARLGWVRAGELSGAADDGAQQLASQWGLLSLSCVRADVESTARLGRELLQRGSRADEVASLMTGHFGLGRAALFCGDLAEALTRFGEANALCDTVDEAARLEIFGWLDPAVLCRVNRGFVLALLGDQAEAAASIADGINVAGRAGHPLSVGAAMMFGAVVAVVGGDVAQAGERARALLTLATKHGLPDFVAQATIFHGWASSQQGRTEAGLAALAEGIAAKRSAGFRMWQTVDLALLADGCRRAGRGDAALQAVEDALAEVEATGERLYEANLLRMRGELLAEYRPGAVAEAQRCLSRAVALATAQGARPFRQRAELALARVPTP
ncbi:MAG: BTAD domain-containing putative transcriptional regulator [Acidimicrobiales bacterium]